MAKRKTKVEKELARLRRENEILRSQLKSKREKDITQYEGAEEISVSNSRGDQVIVSHTNPKHLKDDLTNTLLVTALALFLLAFLYYTEGWWIPLF